MSNADPGGSAEPHEPGSGPDPSHPAGRDLAEIHDLADDVITVGGDEPATESGAPEDNRPEVPGREPGDPKPGGPETGALGAAGSAAAGSGAGSGSGGADRGRQFVDTKHRAQMATESEPNGWFAGPHADPDRFELLGPGLAGGEGNTWRGRYRGELTAPLTLAVKELRRPPHAPPEWPTAAELRRWNDQRALLQYMRIDHLVTVIDIFVGPAPHLPGTARPTPETPYVVMEWVPGPTLADELSGIPATGATLDERLAHVQHVAEALHSLHSQTASAGNPTLHRDVKPTNCILDPRRGVVLVDVGTMRRMDDGQDHDGFHTPAYTAPEVLANPRAARAAASDLYSLGALAYFCVVGEDPPVADRPGAAELIHGRLLTTAREAGIADVNGFVDHLRLMLDPSPHQRPGDSMSWSRRLRALAALRGRRPALLRSRRAKVTAAAGLVAVALGIGVLCAVCLAVGRDDAQLSADGNALGSARIPGASPGSSAPHYGPPPGPPPPGPPPGGGGPPPSGTLPSAASPQPDGTIKSQFATITAPRNGGPALLCSIVKGTSKLPAGQTLVTSVENLAFGDGARHLQVVQGWDDPSTLGSWQGRQFVGVPEDPVGGKFKIEVIMASLAGLKQQINAAGGERGGWRSQYPPEAKIVASAIVTRAEGTDLGRCG